MQSLIADLLRVSISLLLAVQGSPQIPGELQNDVVNIVSRSVQISTQVMVYDEKTAQKPSANIWPNAERLGKSYYLNPEGKYILLGGSITVLDSYTSFGELNFDLLDDAAAVILETDRGGNTNYALAGMINQAGVLFNVAKKPLGKKVEVYSHGIRQGQLTMDMKIDSSPRRTYSFRLVGNEFREMANN